MATHLHSHTMQRAHGCDAAAHNCCSLRASKRTAGGFEWAASMFREIPPGFRCKLDREGDPLPRAMNLNHILLYAARQASRISLTRRSPTGDAH